MVRGAALAFSIAIAGCASGISPASSTPCALPMGISAVLVAPAPGSPNNNTVPPQIVVATTSPIPSTWAAILIVPPNTNAGAARFGGTIQQTQAPSTVPPAFQLPSFPNPNYYASPFGIQSFPLPLGATITVQLYDTGTNCSPGVTVGSFVTST